MILNNSKRADERKRYLDPYLFNPDDYNKECTMFKSFLSSYESFFVFRSGSHMWKGILMDDRFSSLLTLSFSTDIFFSTLFLSRPVTKQMSPFQCGVCVQFPFSVVKTSRVTHRPLHIPTFGYTLQWIFGLPVLSS